MSSFHPFITRALSIVVVLCLMAGVLTAQEQTGDVLRINTELVQTDVMVFDKTDRLVEGLSAEHFELPLDGKAHPISCFERIKTGSASEAAQGLPPGRYLLQVTATDRATKASATQSARFTVE